MMAGLAFFRGEPVVVMGMAKGHTPDDMAARNHGMPAPSGYRTALRLMGLAERFGLHTVRRALIVAPAMNTFMWNQRVTAEHLATLRRRGVQVVAPVVKMLACGDTGMGAMASVEDVVAAAVAALRDYSRKAEQASAQGKPPFEI